MHDPRSGFGDPRHVVVRNMVLSEGYIDHVLAERSENEAVRLRHTEKVREMVALGQAPEQLLAILEADDARRARGEELPPRAKPVIEPEPIETAAQVGELQSVERVPDDIAPQTPPPVTDVPEASPSMTSDSVPPPPASPNRPTPLRTSASSAPAPELSGPFFARTLLEKVKAKAAESTSAPPSAKSPARANGGPKPASTVPPPASGRTAKPATRANSGSPSPAGRRTVGKSETDGAASSSVPVSAGSDTTTPPASPSGQEGSSNVFESKPVKVTGKVSPEEYWNGLDLRELVGPKRPMSEANRAAQSVRGRQAVGRKSEAGKQISAMNRISHSFYSTKDYIPAGPLKEDPDQVREEDEAFVEALKPLDVVVRRAGFHLARVLRTEGRMDIFESLSFVPSTKNNAATHEQVLLREAQRQRKVIEAALVWIDAVQEAVEREHSWNWRRVISTTLKPGAAEAMSWMLCKRMRKELAEGDLYDIAPKTEQAWQKVLRSFLLQHFHGDLQNFAAWLIQEADKMDKEITFQAADVAADEAIANRKALVEGLASMNTLMQVRKVNNERIKVAWTLFEAAQQRAAGPVALNDGAE